MSSLQSNISLYEYEDDEVRATFTTLISEIIKNPSLIFVI